MASTIRDDPYMAEKKYIYGLLVVDPYGMFLSMV